ncbi:hypothetical protein MYAM1_002666 [Malassezia yamatoensis]|uniref:Dolichyl-diphosphooligosaccharide--protein glycosyltransferase subunit 2 n=1 Tax=Malassezia yamatoensis TaxID=253288 RepID=A0AAJ5YV08_9BASI|nr:hypothetical protein MYAM1_002666 [Malassezia yamatoensis]
MQVVKVIARFIAVCVLCALAACASSYDIRDARLSVQTLDGSPRLTEKFATKHDVTQVKLLHAEADDVIRFSFSIASDTPGEAMDLERIPQQTWVVLSNVDPKQPTRSFIWPLRVRESSASATFHLRMDKLPKEVRRMLAGNGEKPTYALTLLLGAFASSEQSQLDALSLPFLHLRFSQGLLARFSSPATSSRAMAEAQDGFTPLPQHSHTFATEPWQSMPPTILSLAIAIGVFVGPWLLLQTLWKPYLRTKSSLTLPETLLLISVSALEILALLYWAGAPVWIVGPTAFLLGSGAFLSGREAVAKLYVL